MIIKLISHVTKTSTYCVLQVSYIKMNVDVYLKHRQVFIINVANLNKRKTVWLFGICASARNDNKSSSVFALTSLARKSRLSSPKLQTWHLATRTQAQTISIKRLKVLQVILKVT